MERAGDEIWLATQIRPSPHGKLGAKLLRLEKILQNADLYYLALDAACSPLQLESGRSRVGRSEERRPGTSELWGGFEIAVRSPRSLGPGSMRAWTTHQLMMPCMAVCGALGAGLS